MIRRIFGFGPQYFGFATSTSLLPGCHDWSMYGPVPIGCCVPNVPVGWKTPVESTVPASAWYFLRAVGEAIPKLGSPIADRNDEDGRRSRIETEYWPCALQPLYRLLSGPRPPGAGWANPPNTVCQ